VLGSPELLMMHAQAAGDVSYTSSSSSVPTIHSLLPPFPAFPMPYPLTRPPPSRKPTYGPSLTPRRQSIPATRLRWMRILCGYDQQAPQHDGAGADDDDDDDAQRQHDRAAGKAPAGRKAYGRGPARRTSGDRGGSGR